MDKTWEWVKLLAIGQGLNLIYAATTLLVGWWVAKTAAQAIRKILGKRHLDPTIISFVGNLAYMGLMTFVVIAALGRVGVETGSFIAVIGAAGLAVGLALQGSLSNFASGVLIILFRPFKAGDFIEAAGVSGLVEEVQVFATILTTLDNKKVIMPNSAITGGTIVNYSAKENRRVDLVFGIGYQDDIKKAKQVIEGVLQKNPLILKDPAPQIAVLSLGDSSVNLAVRPWAKTEHYWDVYLGLMEEIKLAFDTAKISIPFPQRDVHLYQETPKG